MKKKLFAIVLALVMALSLAACGGNTNQPATPAAPSSPGAPSTAPKEITVAFHAMPNGLCPITEDVFQTMSPCFTFYDHLVQLDENWVWQPAVAKTWNQVDSVNWEFEINMDYVFHNGDPITMDDVVFSLLRLKDIPKSAHAANRMKSVTYEGNTLNIELNAPNNAAIPQILWFAIIVNKAYIEAGGDDAIYLKPIGTGPFFLKEFTPGASVRVERWEDYPFEQPKIDAINFTAIPEDTNRYIAVESGQITYAGLVTAFEIDLAKKDGRFNIIEDISARTCTFFFNTEREPFTDVNVRTALTHAFDRESFCDLAGGRQPLESSLFGRFDLYYVSEYLPEYNMDKAREMLEAAGINASNPLNMEIIHFFADPGLELYQSALKSLNVNATITLTEFSVYLAREGGGDFDMCFAGLSNKGGTPLVDLERYDSTFVGTRNNSRYVNPVMDDLIGQMRTVLDPVEMQRLCVVVNDLAAQESIFIPGYLQGNYAVMDNKLSGITIRGDMMQDFRGAVYTG